MKDSEELEQLPEAAERLLQNWPDGSRSDADFERMARAVDARISRGRASSNPPPSIVEGWLFRPPLPLQAGEPRQSAEASDAANLGTRSPNTLSLKEIARAALEATSGNEGAGCAEPNAGPPKSVARPPLESVTRERDDRVSRVAVVALASAKRPPVASTSPRTVATDPGGGSKAERSPTVSAIAGDAQQKPGTKTLARLWMWSTLAAAAVALYVGNREETDAVVIASQDTMTEAAATADVPLPGTPAGKPASHAAATNSTGAADAEGATTVASSSSPAVRSQERAPGVEPIPAPRKLTDLPSAAAPSPQKVTARKVTTPSPTEASKPVRPSPGTPGTPGTEVPADEPRLVPAAHAAGVPQHPSIGAAQGAVGSVLGAARACVAGQFNASKAEVVFSSDGRVKRVAVTGPARGTPAETCITNAMRNARVQPFSDETFSVRTTVRP